MEEQLTFGAWIKIRRKQRGLIQSELADLTSCSLGTIRKIEQNERRPSKQLAELMLSALDIPTELQQDFVAFARSDGRYYTVPDTLIHFLNQPASYLKSGYVKTDLEVRHLDETLSIDLASQALESRFKQLVAQSTLPYFLDGKTVQQRIDPLPFVARDMELQRLQAHLTQAQLGQGQLIFVQGEAGSGKTSLVERFAKEARNGRADLFVVRGTCDVYTGVGDPYLPFISILSNLLGDVGAEWMIGLFSDAVAKQFWHLIPFTVRQIIDHAADLIDLFVPRSYVEQQLAAYAHAHPEVYHNCFSLFDALQRVQNWTNVAQNRIFWSFGKLLEKISETHTLVIILDDLHWADLSSIGLLSYLSHNMAHLPLMIIGTFRPEDVSLTTQGDIHPFKRFLDEASRRWGDVFLDLDQPAERNSFVDAFIDSSANRLDRQFRHQLNHLTGGHPLFTVEVLHELEEIGVLQRSAAGELYQVESSWTSLPRRVEGMIAKRFERLNEHLLEMVTVASVIGERFSAEVLALALNVSLGSLIRQLSQLERKHRLLRYDGLQSKGGKSLSSYLFHHNLFQKYLYDQLNKSERRIYHQTVAESVETLFGDGETQHDFPLVDLVRHFKEAEQPLKTTRYLLQAGQRALRLIAYQEAIGHFEHGLDLHRSLDESVATLELGYELNYNSALAYWNGGKLNEALAAYQQAADLAEKLNDSNALAKAAIALQDLHFRCNFELELPQKYVLKALNLMGDDVTPLRVGLLAQRLVYETLRANRKEFGAYMEKLDSLIDTARSLDDLILLKDIFYIPGWIDRRPERLEWRMKIGWEFLELAQHIGSYQTCFDAYSLLLYDAITAGDLKLSKEIQLTMLELAERSQISFKFATNLLAKVMFATLHGQFEEAERGAIEAVHLIDELGFGQKNGVFGMQMFFIRWQQDRLHEIEPLMTLLMNQIPEMGVWKPGLMLLNVTLGNRTSAEKLFDQIIEETLPLSISDSMSSTLLAFLSEGCIGLDRIDMAPLIYEALLPYREYTLILGAINVCLGAASRYLGCLASMNQAWDVAVSHFEHALQLNREMEAWPWLAQTKYQYARMLLQQSLSNSPQTAKGLLEEALQTAGSLKMLGLQRDIVNLNNQYKLR